MRLASKLLLVTLVVAICAWLPRLGYAIYMTTSFVKALPAALETRGLATVGTVPSPLAMLLFPIAAREACGGAVFHLSDTTLAAIQDRGLSFFEGAAEGRGYPPGHWSHHYYVYTPWQETPVPESWVSQGTWSGMPCMGLDRESTRRIVQAAGREGSFYTEKNGGELLVIPSRGLIVFTFFN